MVDTTLLDTPLLVDTPLLLLGAPLLGKTEKSKNDSPPSPPPPPPSPGNILALSGKTKLAVLGKVELTVSVPGFCTESKTPSSSEGVTPLEGVVSGKAVEKSKEVSNAVAKGSALLLI